MYIEGPEPYLMAAALNADEAVTSIESLRGGSKIAKRFQLISLPLSKEDIPELIRKDSVA